MSGLRILGVGLACALGAACMLFPDRMTLARGCDEIPAPYKNLRNSVTLTEDKVPYYRKQFEKQCARCHGVKGDGGGDEAKDQKFPPANFTDREFMNHCSDGQLFYQIVHGGEEKSAMPAFGPESDVGWPEEKIWYMVAFIRRFSQ